uniref:Phosphorylated adapter RNA export protein n=1 Tax=Ditylenchus dipsaci TaxID=166011 RepID=A0A915EI66_9BILA
MSDAGKAWSDMLVMQDLEDMMGSTTGSIAEAVVSRGSESFSVPKASSSVPTVEESSKDGEKPEKEHQDIFESTSNLQNVENFGVSGNPQNRKPKRKRVRGPRGDIQYSSTLSLNCSEAGVSNNNWKSNKKVKHNHNQEESAKSSPLSSSSGRIPANKYVPTVLLSSDYDKDAFFNATLPVNPTLEESITFIAKTLGEQKPEIIEKVVGHVGIEKAIALFNECRQVEKSGGMLVNFGHRRRTPGGVFLQLFKTDKEVSQDAKSAIASFTKELFRPKPKTGGQRPSSSSKEHQNIESMDSSASIVIQTDEILQKIILIPNKREMYSMF